MFYNESKKVSRYVHVSAEKNFLDTGRYSLFPHLTTVGAFRRYKPRLLLWLVTRLPSVTLAIAVQMCLQLLDQCPKF